MTPTVLSPAKTYMHKPNEGNDLKSTASGNSDSLHSQHISHHLTEPGRKSELVSAFPEHHPFFAPGFSYPVLLPRVVGSDADSHSLPITVSRESTLAF